MKNKRFSSILVLPLAISALFMVYSCGSSDATKKPKGIILPEGDNATLIKEGGYTTIQFPETLDAADRDRYDVDLLGYLIKANAPINTSGSEYDGFPIYYYMHDFKEWLYKGIYSNPQEMSVAKIKTVKIGNNRMRLRDFNTKMPLLNDSREKKNDQSYQNEVMFGENYYFFIEVVLRD